MYSGKGSREDGRRRSLLDALTAAVRLFLGLFRRGFRVCCAADRLRIADAEYTVAARLCAASSTSQRLLVLP